ncbi:MAG: cadmium-translocating P-type ATPase [Chryseobacterium sp.]|nr:MAG: cadmium-translocating P-type ATPase [Chryseobacterium sp.]
MAECCTTEPKNKKPQHDHDGHDHSHDIADKTRLQLFLPALISGALLAVGLLMDYWLKPDWFQGPARIVLYTLAYLPVGLSVLGEAVRSIRFRDFFSEFLLMSVATLGAFAIGEYPEGVAVMLFYAVGEIFQTLAVQRARTNISKLLDQRPDEVLLMDGDRQIPTKAETVQPGAIILVRPGDKLALDGELLSDKASLNTAALTGESVPQSFSKGEKVLAGMINLNTPARVKVTAAYEDSKLSRILELVQDASSQKAPTELFISKMAKVYTPIVFGLAVAIIILPYFFVADYDFRDWLYRALIFLVISCPCALVISIPLGYFGGIGAASRNGILVKGGNFLDILAKVKTIVTDKTGTMTEGVFQVRETKLQQGFDEKSLLLAVDAVERNSTHPVATAIHHYVGDGDPTLKVTDSEEIPGHGIHATVNGKEYLVGNYKLLKRFNIDYSEPDGNAAQTLIAVAEDGRYAGYIAISDKIKEDAAAAVSALKTLGVKTVMLSGDKQSVVTEVARELGIDNAFGELLPEDKVERFRDIKAQDGTVAFVGDGVNDAPVVALSDAGIAMGGLGSDATIETADVVIQDDKPSKLPMAVRIGRKTKQIVWQNIGLALAVKAAVLVLGAGGIATMWEAVFADVGVALLAILNAVRIQRMRF